jgi:hypothetical protein
MFTNKKTKIKLLRIVLTAVVVLVGFRGIQAYADGYGVTASVPYPAPNQAAVIDPSLDGTTVSDALQTVTGTCEITSPDTVVSIWSGQSSLGSTACDSGTFSVQIMLASGNNTLIARSASVSSLYGPDSTPITIILNLPVVITPPTPPTGTPTAPPATPQTIQVAANAAVSAGLKIATTTPFTALSSSNSVTINVVVSGGTRPYTVFLNWGDGTTETYTVPLPGTYAFSHVYQVTGSYEIRGQLEDAVGALTQFSYSVVSPKLVGVLHSAVAKVSSHTSRSRRIAPIDIILLCIVVLFLDYRLGWRRAKKRFKPVAPQKKYAKIKTRR